MVTPPYFHVLTLPQNPKSSESRLLNNHQAHHKHLAVDTKTYMPRVAHHHSIVCLLILVYLFVSVSLCVSVSAFTGRLCLYVRVSVYLCLCLLVCTCVPCMAWLDPLVFWLLANASAWGWEQLAFSFYPLRFSKFGSVWNYQFNWRKTKICTLLL